MTALAAALRPTLADSLLPDASAAESAALVAGASLAIALGAQVAIPLPFTPVPVTGQTLAVLYAGALLGPRRGAAAAALYLFEGCSGLPFFAGGAGGAAHLLGPSGGYLLGFLPAAWLTGTLARRGWDRAPLKALAMMLLGSLPIFAFGLAGLARFVEPSRLLALGFLPFVPGDLLKAALSAGLLPWGWRLLGRRGA